MRQRDPFFCHRTNICNVQTYLAVGSILLQMDMYAFSDLQEPAPLGLQGVHVGLWVFAEASIQINVK